MLNERNQAQSTYCIISLKRNVQDNQSKETEIRLGRREGFAE